MRDPQHLTGIRPAIDREARRNVRREAQTRQSHRIRVRPRRNLRPHCEGQAALSTVRVDRAARIVQTLAAPDRPPRGRDRRIQAHQGNIRQRQRRASRRHKSRTQLHLESAV